MKMKFRLNRNLLMIGACLLLLGVGSSASLGADELSGKLGIGFDRIGAGLIQGPSARLWLSDWIGVEGLLGIDISSPDKGDTISNIGLGGKLIIPLLKRDKVDFRISGDIGLQFLDEKEALTNVGLGLQVGSEYFLTPQLGLEISVGAGLKIYDSDGEDKTDFNFFGDRLGQMAFHYYFDLY